MTRRYHLTKIAHSISGEGIEKAWLGKRRFTEFADNIVLLDESAELQKMIEELHSKSFAVGLNINANKYKVMINKHAEHVVFSIGNETLEHEEYNYLGQLVSADSCHKNAASCRQALTINDK